MSPRVLICSLSSRLPTRSLHECLPRPGITLSKAGSSHTPHWLRWQGPARGGRHRARPDRHPSLWMHAKPKPHSFKGEISCSIYILQKHAFHLKQKKKKLFLASLMLKNKSSSVDSEMNRSRSHSSHRFQVLIRALQGSPTAPWSLHSPLEHFKVFINNS